MKKTFALLATLAALFLSPYSKAQPAITNRSNDAAVHAHISQVEIQAEITEDRAVGKIEESRQLSENQFLQAMAGPDVVLLDTQNAMKYQSRHIKGALNLGPHLLAAASVTPLIPSEKTKVLIYGGSNFRSGPPNITAFVNIYTYGHTNVFELDPTLDIRTTLLPLAGDDADK